MFSLLTFTSHSLLLVPSLCDPESNDNSNSLPCCPGSWLTLCFLFRRQGEDPLSFLTLSLMRLSHIILLRWAKAFLHSLIFFNIWLSVKSKESKRNYVILICCKTLNSYESKGCKKDYYLIFFVTCQLNFNLHTYSLTSREHWEDEMRVQVVKYLKSLRSR